MKIIVSSDICIFVCIWKATCRKMFSDNGRDIKYADFVRDVSINKEVSKDYEVKETNSEENK